MTLVLPPPVRWDREADVVVVGCGYAGAIAAIAAHDAGAGVMLFEKGDTPGGISICSAGGVRVARSQSDALAYLERTNGGRAPSELLEALAEGMVALPQRLGALADAVGLSTDYRASAGNYPFPGGDTFGFVTVSPIEGFNEKQHYRHVRGAAEGVRLFHMLALNLQRRAIVPQLRTPVTRLFAQDGRIVGVLVETPGGAQAVFARGGVVLASGGFEGAPDLQARHWPAQPVLTAAYRGNTGDGIRLAQAAGADLWHMYHWHGSYGFRHPDPAYPFGIRTKRLPDWLPGAGPPSGVQMPWILLDKRGRRFMNEYEPYLQDTGARPMERYDPDHQDFAALPAWLLLDSAGLARWPLGRPTSHEPGIAYDWSPDNSAEIANGILTLLPDIDALAKATGISVARLSDTIGRWNAACAQGRDEDWGRPATSMVPLGAGPFVLAKAWPIVSNTQGGPVHDARQRVLGPDGDPVTGLYAAGELGSLFGHLYLSGGNIAECFVGGQIAGENAARAAAGRSAE
ncbi:Succinate dehydrogenase/fumarate reductase, flavoprotein subunit [Devosia enhydra]|uniref:Succinate dehydrogenase/fumarate reductase, flavoprotein subunit n=1 Tax=Devosia enhydra TaxID=665118 RepID=A0A1K2HXR2_9HYPH|nr:FAD-dependent oxidoreductase [Devosia enhydra]SFZ84554.1 Succinate dehydrogenase/fumarate reductase, flavoprotein subunit [Devosia enhydra]